MISIVIVSHSPSLAKGVRELCLMMNNDAPIYAVGGSCDNTLGTDYTHIKETLESVYTSDGIIVLYDIGSSEMTSKIAIEELKEKGLNNIKIFDAPLVEGAIKASFDIYKTNNIDEIDLSIDTLKKD